RHTRFSRDWSSDVCSSDLATGAAAPPVSQSQENAARGHAPQRISHVLRRALSTLSEPDPSHWRIPAGKAHATTGIGAGTCGLRRDRKSTRLNSSHVKISYA